MPGRTSVFHGGGARSRRPRGRGFDPSERFPSSGSPACCRLVPLSAHLSVAEAAGPPESYAQMGSRSGTALCTSLRGPHKDDAIPETQPPHESRYNDSLTGSNACATMGLTGRAFFLSQSSNARRFSPQVARSLSTAHPPTPSFFTGGYSAETAIRVDLAWCLRVGAKRHRSHTQAKCRLTAPHRLNGPGMSVRRSSAGNPPSLR